MFVTGKITLEPDEDGWKSIVAIGGEKVSELLENYRYSRVWASYGFSPVAITPESLLTAAIDQATGDVDARYGAVYSEITGYLWTDNDGTIGGHNMVQIFESHVGEYGALIVETSPIDLEDYVDSLLIDE